MVIFFTEREKVIVKAIIKNEDDKVKALKDYLVNYSQCSKYGEEYENIEEDIEEINIKISSLTEEELKEILKELA